MNKLDKTIIPNGVEQSRMRQEIIQNLEDLIDDWHPQFVISEETAFTSNLILKNLTEAKEIMKQIFLPRTSPQIIDYYDAIMKQIASIKDTNIMNSYSGDGVMQAASFKILEIATKWSGKGR